MEATGIKPGPDIAGGSLLRLAENGPALRACCERRGSSRCSKNIRRSSRAKAAAPAWPGYHAAISACEKARRWEVSLDIAEILATSGLDRSIFASAATISACEKGKQWRKAFEVFALAAERLLELNAVAWTEG